MFHGLELGLGVGASVQSFCLSVLKAVVRKPSAVVKQPLNAAMQTLHSRSPLRLGYLFVEGL